MKAIDSDTKRAIPIATKWNDRDFKNLKEFMVMIGEKKTSTAIKKGVLIAKVILAPISKEFDITLSPKKPGFKRPKNLDSDDFVG